VEVEDILQGADIGADVSGSKRSWHGGSPREGR